MRETKNEATDAIPSHRQARVDPALEAAQIRLDDLLVALDGEQQRDVDVDAAGGQLLDRADAAAGRRHLDQHVGEIEPVPELERLGDRRLGVVGDVGRALERDEAVTPAAALIRRTQGRRRAAHVVERDREEQLL